MLFFAAIAAGAVNTMAGGGGLLTFPLLMTVVAPVTADTTSAVALLPAYGTSTWVVRKQLVPMRRWFWLLVGPSLLGGLLGALLLSWSGSRSFLALVPWLVLAATLLTLLRPVLTRRADPLRPLPENPLAEQPLPSLGTRIEAAVMLFLVAIYGGYFGAGTGILVIGALGLIGLSDVHSILALKNALCGGLRGVAVLVFLLSGDVNWEYGLVMAAGAFLGGCIGGSLVRWTNRTLVRSGIIVLGFGMTAFYFWKIYGSEMHLIGSD